MNWFDNPPILVKKESLSVPDLRICVDMKKRHGKTPLLLGVDQDDENFDEVVQSKPIEIGATKTFVQRAIQMESMFPDITAMLDTLKIDVDQKPIFESTQEELEVNKPEMFTSISFQAQNNHDEEDSIKQLMDKTGYISVDIPATLLPLFVEFYQEKMTFFQGIVNHHTNTNARIRQYKDIVSSVLDWSSVIIKGLASKRPRGPQNCVNTFSGINIFSYANPNDSGKVVNTSHFEVVGEESLCRCLDIILVFLAEMSLNTKEDAQTLYRKLVED